MAKYDVDHACGHSETHQIYGPHKDRDREIAWLTGKTCSACYHAALVAGREAANARAAEHSRSLGLPTLSGTEKQVAWAETIRVAAIRNFEVAEAELLEKEGLDSTLSEAARLEISDALALIGSELLARVDSHWWIDHRGDSYDRRDVLRGIRDRGLIPIAIGEHEAAKRASKRVAEDAARFNQAAYAAKFDRAKSVAASIRIDDSTVSVDGRTVTVRDGELELRYRPYVWEASDSEGDCGITLQVPRESEVWEVASRIVAASLAFVSVVSATATKQRSENLAVRLSDGREITGHHTQKLTDLSKICDRSLPADHPEVARIRAEVRKVVARV